MTGRPKLPPPSSFSFIPPAFPGPQQSQQPPVPPPHPPGKPTYTKRGKITIVACLPCRKRKTKCDGKRPSCSQCLARDGTNCMYDMTDDQRRLTYLRDNVEQLVEEKKVLESLIWSLQTRNEEQVSKIVRLLRNGTDVYMLAQQIHSERMQIGSFRSELMPPAPSDHPVGQSMAPLPLPRLEQYKALLQTMAEAPSEDLPEICRRLWDGEDVDNILTMTRRRSINQTSNTRYVDNPHATHPSVYPAQNTNTSNDAIDPAQPRKTSLAQWTNVTHDSEFVQHLMDLYFIWHHPLLQCFPEDLFKDDYHSGRTKFCSALIVNAICAAGALFSDRRMARKDISDPSTAGLAFHDEAIRLIADPHVSDVKTTAAITILCHAMASRGNFTSMWMLSGQSSRIALDINLHLSMERHAGEQTHTYSEREAKWRAQAFWACFVQDQMTSFTLGRLPILPATCITVELPTISDENSVEKRSYSTASPRFSWPITNNASFIHIVALSKIINSTLQLFFAPATPISGNLLLTEYDKYLRWYSGLPRSITNFENVSPHIYLLLMYYNAAVLSLFRPFLKAKFTHSTISPREVCRSSASTISDIFSRYQQIFGLMGIHGIQLHCLLSACMIHIINMPTIASTKHFTHACNIFQDLVPKSEYAASSLHILQGLVQKWNITLPLEAETALSRNLPNPSYPFGISPGSLPHCPYPNYAIAPPLADNVLSPIHTTEGSQSEKRIGIQSPPIQTLTKRPRLGPIHPSGPTSVDSTGGVSAINYLFAPISSQPAPLLGPVHTSTDANMDWRDEVGKITQGFEGLTFSGDDLFDPFMGFSGE